MLTPEREQAIREWAKDDGVVPRVGFDVLCRDLLAEIDRLRAESAALSDVNRRLCAENKELTGIVQGST